MVQINYLGRFQKHFVLEFLYDFKCKLKDLIGSYLFNKLYNALIFNTLKFIFKEYSYIFVTG